MYMDEGIWTGYVVPRESTSKSIAKTPLMTAAARVESARFFIVLKVGHYFFGLTRDARQTSPFLAIFETAWIKSQKHQYHRK